MKSWAVKVEPLINLLMQSASSGKSSSSNNNVLASLSSSSSSGLERLPLLPYTLPMYPFDLITNSLVQFSIVAASSGDFIEANRLWSVATQRAAAVNCSYTSCFLLLNRYYFVYHLGETLTLPEATVLYENLKVCILLLSTPFSPCLLTPSFFLSRRSLSLSSLLRSLTFPVSFYFPLLGPPIRLLRRSAVSRSRFGTERGWGITGGASARNEPDRKRCGIVFAIVWGAG